MPSAAPDILRIAPARPDDARRFAAYVVEHVAESGRDGSPVFAVSTRVVAEDVQRGALDRWAKRLDEPLWGRAWLMWTAPRQAGSAGPREPARVVGHIELRGGRVQSELHRAVLAMGMLRRYTGRGHGRRLLDVALGWARDEAGLSYVDLGVFTGNEPARRLYARAGFVPVGTRRDAFRVAGVVVDDIQMTLSLREPAARGTRRDEDAS